MQMTRIDGLGGAPRLMARWRVAVALSIGCLLLAGCGYTLVGASSTAGANTRVTLAVPPVINLTREPDLERRMTAALRRAVAQAPALRLASEPQAQYTLQGVVRQFQALPASFDARDRAVQFRIESRMRVRLTDRQSARFLLDQEITAWAEYLVSPSGSMRENAAARSAGLARVSRQLAEKCQALIEITLM